MKVIQKNNGLAYYAIQVKEENTSEIYSLFKATSHYKNGYFLSVTMPNGWSIPKDIWIIFSQNTGYYHLITIVSEQEFKEIYQEIPMNGPKTYKRKETDTVQAIQIRRENIPAIIEFMGSTNFAITFDSIHGTSVMCSGPNPTDSWIIKDASSIRFMSDKDFKSTYESM